MSHFEHAVESPLGPLTLIADAVGITALEWRDGRRDGTPVLTQAATQLDAYFAGKQQDFTVPIRLTCSDFQRTVCAAMSAIPFGETRTYGDLAAQLGVPAQAIGQACGGNPIGILIPCHRVLGANGLGGYSGDGGVETKVWLLRHEGAAGLLI
ncbi:MULTISPECIES: methylated-DNA--[protein]-cysteine S-methyltransferase [Marivita]|uniref:Methylated-DNA--protein-cysteine methyltransferase n=1 Tax=Marivita cryptomonadis TaxID=505252 RepID=A0A9Q2S394_9RHOB|nr:MULTISPECIES: methylated-DNA--[protein]-cysteine S-methyltransferase [Marivita]MCR9167063.1 methylated-DNA--[protein]-cysteine S-methyltransferase [Paracoccaceae bacterium]MBM2319941.1 methylated-DNA--[protein]-cysteine S-methyltransferase [Marivita cryptomonadis]MBM2329520.1 methylated-DNA--[protein]-cysteine S-methyltransferase [Marivita cryptomonadis]MBM2339108.1 methylated-DNA--[protein]-cysteine S-methyltransferase [Marivita cryptomonadis]MBM2343766.1 methylated-DNA--[protein]-cysteine